MRAMSLNASTGGGVFVLPPLFILMWSSGYVAGKLGIPYAGPFTLLLLRFASAALILLVVSLCSATPWPRRGAMYGHLVVVGLLIQVLQFFGLYTALKLGVTAGVSALFIGTMPIFTALGAGLFLGERLTRKQGAGLAMGLAGVCMVVANKLGAGSAGVGGYVAALLGLAGITFGTLYQKKFCAGVDLRVAGLVQLAFASVVALGFAGAFEHYAVRWSATLLWASAWLAIVNSIGAISLLYLLMRTGEASKVASLFYLIPGVTAVMAYLLLGETLAPLALAGFLTTGVAVYFCTRK